MTKGQQTRQRIIALAAPLFNQSGLAGCSMQDVMEATGLEKGGLYRYFSSKEELAAECLQYALVLALETRTGDAEHIPDAMGKLRYLVDRFVSTPSPLQGGCPLMNAAVDADDGNPQLLGLTQRALAEWKLRLTKIVIKGIKAGEILPGTDPVRLANTIVATLEGSLLISRIEGSPKAREDAKITLHQILDSISVSK